MFIGPCVFREPGGESMGKEYRAYRFRLYPDAAQEEQMARTFGCCRFLYNRMLEDKIKQYEEDGKMNRTTPAMYKGEYPWLKDVDSLALANVQLHLLDRARRDLFLAVSQKLALGAVRTKLRDKFQMCLI